MSAGIIDVGRSHVRISRLSPWVWGLVVAIAAALLCPASGTDLDDVFYIDMVHHLVTNGSLAIADTGGVTGAPTLERYFALEVDGRAVPQYPSGYAFLAAPFYFLFGVNGLILMSALSFVGILWVTRRIALRLFADNWIANAAVLLVAAASFVPAYALAVRPQLLTILLGLAGVERLLAGANQVQQERGGPWAVFLGGLLMAAALNVRADAVLALPPALIWLRGFGAPSNRLAGLVFVAGMVPSLLVASVINHAKFGVFLPVSYGPVEPGFADVSRYTGLLGLMGLGFAGLMLVDFGRPWVRRVGEIAVAPRSLIGLAVLGGLSLLASETVRTYAFNIYVLVVDLQQLDATYWRLAVIDGFIDFWGYRKFALLQSMPFAILAGLGLIAICRQRHVRALALCFGMIATPILFFSINQWHGGGSLSMRYFLMAVPFLGIVSAWALDELGVPASVDRPLLVRLGIAGFAIILVGKMLFGFLPAPADKWFQYYGPLALTAGLLGLWLVGLWPGLKERLHSTMRLAACVAIGAAGAITLEEVSMMAGLQQATHQRSEIVANAFPPGSLVIAISENEMADASREGVHILSRRVTDPATQRLAMDAFIADGRCVYVYRGGPGALFPADGPATFTTRPTEADPDVWVPAHQSDACHMRLDPWIEAAAETGT